MEGKIEFQTNVPVELALQFLQGKEVESRFGSGKQHLFSTSDGRRFYVSDTVGQILSGQIQKQGIQPGEPIEICKQEMNQGRGRKGIEWKVTKVGQVPGEQANGTLVVPGAGVSAPAPTQVPAAGVSAPAAASATVVTQQTTHNGNGNSFAHTGWAAFLLAQTNTLVDVYAAALRYAGERHGNNVKPEDVRALLTTSFINVSRGGSANVA